MTETFPLYKGIQDGEAIPFRGTPAQEAFGETKELMNKYGVDSYFEFKDGEIHGSELRSMILLNKVLRKKGQRTLTFDEAMQLGKNFLPKNFYADLGIAVYETPGVNEEIGKILRPEISHRNLQYPILAHPSSLDLGEVLTFGKDDSLIISGERAVEELRKFNYVKSSGVRGLGRGGNGNFDADWGGLFSSDESGRVPFVRVVGTPQNFESEIVSAIEKEHQAEVQRLEARKQKAIQIALETYRAKE